MEAFIKSGAKPQTNVGDIYMLNTHLVMVFLHQTGFSNSFDLLKLTSRVKKLEKKFVQYKIKYDENLTTQYYDTTLFGSELSS